jgi:iron complex outermembrane receptor protein
MKLLSQGIMYAAALTILASVTHGQVLDEIVVTAQKREQNLQDVSVAVTAFSGDDIRELGIERTVDLARHTPGLNIKSAIGDQNPVISIRGMGLNDFLSNNSPTASVYIDQVVVPSHAMLGSQLFDIERIEVLKGPQGTLYGRNTTAGAINFISVAPSEEFEAFVSADFSEYETFQVEGAIGGSLSDTVTARFSALYRNRGEGYQFNRFLNEKHGEQERFSARLQLLFAPSDSFDILVNIHAGTEDSDSPFYEHNGSLVPEGAPFDNIAVFCDAALAGNQVSDGSCVDFWGYFDPDEDPHEGDWDAVFGNIHKSDTAGIGITANFDFGGFILTSVTGYDTLDRVLAEDVDNSPFASIDDLHEDDITAFSQEFRLTSTNEDASFDWILGAFYSDDKLLRDLTEDVTDLDGFVINGFFEQNSQSTALFAHGSFTVSEKLRLNAGLRFTNETKDFTMSRFDDSLFVFGGTSDLDDNDTSGELGLEYRPNDDTLLYGKLSKGYKSGNFNGSVGVRSQLQLIPTDAEEVFAYELGYKGTLLDNRLRLNLSAYFNQWDNFQNRGVHRIDGQLVSSLVSAGDAEILGLEVDLLWVPADGWEIALGANLMGTEVVRGAENPTSGVRVSEGNRLQNSPETAINGRFGYSWPTGNDLVVALMADFNWQDNVFFNVDNNPFHAQDSYSLWGARATLGTDDGKWEVALWARNLGDEDYRVEVFDIFVLGSSLFIYGEPRTSGITLRYNF